MEGGRVGMESERWSEVRDGVSEGWRERCCDGWNERNGVRVE